MATPWTMTARSALHVTTLSEALTTGRGVERPFRCQVHDDSNASASVNVLKGVWVCYACGAHGIVDGEAAVPSAEDLLKLLAEDEPPRLYPESWLDTFDAFGPSPYWEGRYGYAIARRFRCGTHPLTGAPTYPVRDASGQICGVVIRQENAEPKYKYPFGARVSETFFGTIAPCKVAILVEGASDVMAVEQPGLPADWRVWGCYGSGLHYPQAQILAEMSPAVVIAAFDDDKAGQLAIERAQYTLQDIAPVVSHLWGTVGGSDPGNVDADRRIESLRETLRTTPFKALANT